MKLVIRNCDDKQFIIYLIKFIKQYLLDNSNSRKLIKLNNYLNSIPKYKSKFKRSITGREIIICGAYNLKYRKFGDQYIITIDENQKLFGIDAKLYDMCKLINYGTLNVDGFPVFTDAFSFVENNLATLHWQYTTGL